MNNMPINIHEWYGDPTMFGMYVQMRALPGISSVDKFGTNPLIEPATDPEDVWEYGGIYPHDADGTAPIAYVSSSSAADTGQAISVQGLDIEGNLTENLITTNGQTAVVMDTPLWRVFRMENQSDAGGDIQGILYCGTEAVPVGGVPAAANVRAMMSNGNNQTLMALYTVPKGKVGFIFRGEFGMGVPPGSGPFATSVSAKVRYESRRFGKVFKVKKELDLITGGNSNYDDKRSFPDLVPELTDIRMRVQEVTDDCSVWGTLDLILFDSDKVPRGLQKLLGYRS